MGYYTNYSLEMEPNDDGIWEIIKDEYDMEHLYYDDSDSVKWYEHEKDMMSFSKRFPNTLFKLHGVGEANEDVWYKYFKNGKMQVCEAKITFDPYDESKLE